MIDPITKMTIVQIVLALATECNEPSTKIDLKYFSLQGELQRGNIHENNPLCSSSNRICVICSLRKSLYA